MNRGLVFLIVCIFAGALFLLLASEIGKRQPPKGSAGTSTRTGTDGSAPPKGDEGDGGGNVDGGNDDGGPVPFAGASKSELLKQDREAEEYINAPDAREAREWCKADRSRGFEVSTSQMLKWTEELYALGARKVVVVGIEQFEGVEIAASMVVVLPEDKAARKALFDWENKLYENEGEDLVKDLGQKYMHLTFD